MHTKKAKNGARIHPSELKADTSVGQKIAAPMHGIKVQDVLFRRISHQIIDSQTQQKQFFTERFPVGVSHIHPIPERLPSFPEFSSRQQLEILIQLHDLS